MKHFLFVLLFLLAITSGFSQNYEVGSKVEIKYNFAWYKGSIVEVNGDQFKIHYDGYDSSADEWVKADRLRQPASVVTPKAVQPNNRATTQKPIAQQKQVNTAAINNSSYKDTNGKLYFRTFMWTGMYGTSLDISWIYLGNAGTIVRNPENGTNPIDYKAELTTNAENVGKYKIANNKIYITWSNGKEAAWSVEMKAGEISAIDGGIATRPQAVAANYKLSGQYAGGAVLPNVSSIKTFVFSKDGTFTLNRSGAVSTADITGLAQDTNGGTYSITGNTLRLNFDNGQKQVANILIWEMGGGKKYLVINSTSYPQER